MNGCDFTRITYRYEKWRALAAGILEAASSIFLLLIAVRWYKAGPYAKALVAGGGSVGLLLAPWLLLRVERCLACRQSCVPARSSGRAHLRCNGCSSAAAGFRSWFGRHPCNRLGCNSADDASLPRELPRARARQIIFAHDDTAHWDNRSIQRFGRTAFVQSHLAISLSSVGLRWRLGLWRVLPFALSIPCADSLGRDASVSRFSLLA